MLKIEVKKEAMDGDYEFVDDDQSISEYAISSPLKYVCVVKPLPFFVTR